MCVCVCVCVCVRKGVSKGLELKQQLGKLQQEVPWVEWRGSERRKEDEGRNGKRGKEGRMMRREDGEKGGW